MSIGESSSIKRREELACPERSKRMLAIAPPLNFCDSPKKLKTKNPNRPVTLTFKYLLNKSNTLIEKLTLLIHKYNQTYRVVSCNRYKNKSIILLSRFTILV